MYRALLERATLSICGIAESFGQEEEGELSSQLPTIYPHLLCRRCLLKQTWTLLVLQGWHEAQNYNTLKKERGKARFLSTT